MSLTINAARRVIGPVPPRDKNGRLQLAPIIGRRPKIDEIGNPVRDDEGRILYEQGDTRDPREYAAYEHGQKPDPAALKGMRLFQVDLDPEPIVQVYARHEAEAVEVYKREMGITRFGQTDPKVSEVGS